MALYIEGGYDLADSGYTLDVVETGGNTFQIAETTGTYFLRSTAAAASGDDLASVSGYVSFIAALEVLLDAGGAAASGYTVSFSETTERVTIAHDGTGSVTAISLTATFNGALIGQTATKSGALSHEMDRTPDYWISGAVGMWAQYVERESDKDLYFNQTSHSGKTTGQSRSTTSTELDLTVPLEPRAKVYTIHSATSDPWTWQELFRDQRNVEPLCIDDGTLQHFVRLREPVFAPTPMSIDYVGHYDIRLRTYLAARVVL